jgi:hypothetical protein
MTPCRPDKTLKKSIQIFCRHVFPLTICLIHDTKLCAFQRQELEIRNCRMVSANLRKYVPVRHCQILCHFLSRSHKKSPSAGRQRGFRSYTQTD